MFIRRMKYRCRFYNSYSKFLRLLIRTCVTIVSKEYQHATSRVLVNWQHRHWCLIWKVIRPLNVHNVTLQSSKPNSLSSYTEKHELSSLTNASNNSCYKTSHEDAVSLREENLPFSNLILIFSRIYFGIFSKNEENSL